jgi:polyphosphate kinase 2 (PPK2 family)
VLVARVHPAVLERQKLPAALRTKRIWEERLADIAAFEGYLGRQGVVVVKFFLHLGRDEQRERFLKRIEEPEKNWKFEIGDIIERRHWDAYQDAYEKAIRATATPAAPWYVVPADNKWFTRLVVAEALAQTLESLDLHYPVVTEAERARLAEGRQELG